jgi:LysR family transcriptional regulator, low CO2-responsive transcriptional regulator
MQRHLSLRQLEVIRAVAETGTMAGASQRLYMTAPAISQQVKQLERALGAPAFDRIGRRLKLTAAGERALSAAKDVYTRLSLLGREMDSLRQCGQGTLQLGVLATGTHVLPPLLAEFRRRSPEITVHMAVSTHEELVRRVLEGEVDLALMGRRPEFSPREGVDVPAPLACEPFASNPHVVIAWPDHALADAHSIPPARLSREHFVQRESGSGTRAMLDGFLDAHSVMPRGRITVSGNEMAKHAVMSRLGISLTSMHTLALELKTGALVRLDVQHTPIRRSWYLVYHPERWMPPAAAAFRDYLLTEGVRKVDAEIEALLCAPWPACNCGRD